MTLKKDWFSNKIVSSDGFSVRILDRATILYEERGLCVYVSAEMLAPKDTWAIYPNDMRVGSVQGNRLEDREIRSLVIGRIHEVFEFFGWTLEEG